MKNRNCTVVALAVIALAVAATHNQAQSNYTPYAFTNFAGLPGQPGNMNGTGGLARFDHPRSVAVDSAGNVYVADTYNHTIRKITPGGAVTTLAGSAGQSGSTEGTGSAARFKFPGGVAVDGAGNVYVADRDNHTIRKITPGASVTTLAGSAGQIGSADGTGSAARFYNPEGVAVDTNGNVYVADTFNFTIRKITPAGETTTPAGSAGQSGSANGTGSAARFNFSRGVAVDSAGNVYVADRDNHTIRKITPGGEVTTLAGSAGQQGSNDGPGSAARFSSPLGAAADSVGDLCVADYNNSTIRKITSASVVTTLAGTAGQSGSADGTGSAARFYNPEGVAVDTNGNVYVADTVNNRITKGTPVAPPAPLQFVTSLGGPTVSNGLFQVRLIGPSGSNVVVEASANLQAWTPVQTNALPAAGLEVSVPLDTNQIQFFRARLAP